MSQNRIPWPVGYCGPWNDPQPPGGVAPSRADLALARHLEKRAAHAAAERDLTLTAGSIILALGKLRCGILGPAKPRRPVGRMRLVG